MDHLREFPAQVDRVLDTGVEALPADRRVDVSGVAGQQHSPVPVARRLTAGVGESRNPPSAVDPGVRSSDGAQRAGEIGQRRIATAKAALSHHDSYRSLAEVEE